MPIVSFSEWQTFLERHPEAHLLQMGEWGDLKAAFGWEAVRLVTGKTGAQILFRRLPLGFTFAYIPKGPLTDGAASLGEAAFWQEVDALCRRRRAIFLKVEPDGWQETHPPLTVPPGFVRSVHTIQPRVTLVVDLSGREEDVFERMKPKTRYNIRLAGRKEVEVRVSDDLDAFYHLMQVTSQREAFHVHSLAYYRRAYDLFHPRGMCELFLAEYQGKPLAAVMAFASQRSGYYFYGASANEERQRKPTYPLQWEAIRWAYRRGCAEYDMWGVPPDILQASEEEVESREDGLWGVYRFKRGFGGVLRRAMPALDRIYQPLLYAFYVRRFARRQTE